MGRQVECYKNKDNQFLNNTNIYPYNNNFNIKNQK